MCYYVFDMFNETRARALKFHTAQTRETRRSQNQETDTSPSSLL